MRLIALSERKGCSFFRTTARSSKSLCFFRARPRSQRRRRYSPGTPSSFSRRHWRRRVRAERRFRRPLGSRRSSWLSCWKYRSRRRSGISPSSTGLNSEHQKTAQSSLVQRIKFDSEKGGWTKNPCRSLMLPHQKPDLVAKRGKNFSENTPSHSAIRCSSCRATQPLLTLRTAELLRAHGTGKAVAGGGGATLLDQLATLGQRGGLRPSQVEHAQRSCCDAGPALPWRTTPAAADSRSLAFPGWPSRGRTADRSPSSGRQGAGGSARRNAYRAARKPG